MAGKRAVLLASDPPYGRRLHGRQPPPDLGQGRSPISPAAKTKSGTTTTTPPWGSSFPAFSDAAQSRRFELATGDLHLLCHDARARGLRRLAAGRPAASPGHHLGKDAGRAGPLGLTVRLRAGPLRLDRGNVRPRSAGHRPRHGRCGRSPRRSRTARVVCTPRRSRSSSCVARSSTTRAPARSSTSRLPARARPSSPPR